MQTFLPYQYFSECAEVLDRQRLGKQRVEVLQILNTILGKTSGWENHPIVKMWKDYPVSLCYYGIAICGEWVKRGYKDTCLEKITVIWKDLLNKNYTDAPPPWLGKEEFHRSHQSNLVRKNPEHYRRYFPNVPDDLPYIWY